MNNVVKLQTDKPAAEAKPHQVDAEKLDVRAFFRDIERGSHRFLSHWTKLAESNQQLYPYHMTRDAWWREFLKFASKYETY